MNITYHDNVKQPGEAYALLQQASQQLQEMFGSSVDPVSAEWARGEDERGRPRYTLTLSDSTGQVSTSFAPDELRPSSLLRYRLRSLWGDLLGVQSDVQIKKIQELVKKGD